MSQMLEQAGTNIGLRAQWLFLSRMSEKKRDRPVNSNLSIGG